MAEIQSNIQVNIDTTEALANLKNLQRQLANFNASFAKSSTAAVRAQAEFSNNLVNSINATGKFSAGIQEIQSSTERFTQSLEKNKFSTREYFRYAAGSTKAFSKIFSSEFNTIQKVAEERVKDLQTQYIKMGRGANGALRAIAVRPLALDMDDLATKVAITSQKQQIFGQLLKQGSTNLLNFGKNTQWAGRQLMVGFTIPLTIFGSKAAQVFMDLEMQAIRFKRVYGEMFTTQGETTKALNEVRKLAQEFTKYGVAVADTMKMAADAAAQGKQGADLMAQVAQATRLAVLGQVEQQQALETTMSLQNAFGYSAEQLAGKINFLNAVENQTVLGIEDLTIAIPKAGPVVKQLGGSVEDLAFFMTAMKEGGINASEGANALKSGLASLINPSDKASAMLEDLGINIKGIVEANKGDLKATVVGFAQALDTLDPLNRARAIEQLFGKFQFARLSTLFQNVTKDSGQAARALDLTGKSVEELAILSERELGTVENATGVKFKKAIENLKTSIAPVGEQFLKAVTPIAEFFSKILNWFNGLSDGVKSGISKIVLIVGAVGPVVLMTFGLLANGLANIIKLFAAVRNGFLGLGKNSNQLAFQTKYMSSEQVEAATIAASLDQAHSKLIQTFTVEKTAVAQLAEVYRQAAMAAGRLQGANPGFFMPGAFGRGATGATGGRNPYPPQPPGMRLATGVVSVPGPKGAGDVVPAMLSPGEAVIPAEQNEKYAPLIQGIIADNIPGYRRGATKIGTEFAHITGRQQTTMGAVLADLESLPAEMQAARAGLIALVRDIVDNFGTQLKAYKYSGLGIAQSPELNNAMQKNRAVSATRFLDDFKSQGLEKWDATLKYAGTNATAVGDELARYDKQLEVAVQKIIDLNQDATITSSQFEAIEKQIRSTLPEFSQLRQALDRAESTMTEFRFNTSQSAARQAGLTPFTVPSAQDPTKMSKKRRVRFKSGREIRLGGDHALVNVPGAFDVEQSIQEIKRSAGVASPSKKTIPIGEDIAKGLEVGMQSRQDDVSRGGQRLANSAVLGVENGVRVDLNKKTRTRSGAAGELTPAPKASLPQYTRDGIRLVPVGTTAPNVADEKDQQLRDAERQRRKTILARTNGVLFGLSSLSSVLGMMGNGIAQKAAPFLVGINMATMAMQMIQGPWSALAVGVVALVAGIYYLTEKNKQQAKAQSQYIETMSATTEKMKSIGQLTGKVGASELMSKRRSMGTLDKYLTGFDRKGQQFGTSMMESDIGKQIYKNFTVALSSDRSGAVKQFGLQLGSYVADGVMSLEQAESFARSIGISLNDMTVSTQIVGQLRELLGPNGENLLENPLELRTKIITDNLNLSKESLKAFKEATSGLNVKDMFWSGFKSIFTETAPEKYAAQIAAVNVQNIETIQAQIDGQKRLYDTKIAELKKQRELTKDKEKQATIDQQIVDLTNKQKEETAALRSNIGKVLKDQLDAYIVANQYNSRLGTEVPFFESLKEQVRQKYKDTNAAGADAFLAKSSNLVSTFSSNETRVKAQKLEVTLDTLVGAGALEVGAATNLLNMFGNDKEKMLKTLSTAFEINDAGQVSEVSNILYTLFGEKNPEIAAKVFTEITSKKGSKKFEDRAATLAALFKLQGKELNVSMIVDDNGGLDKLDQIVELSNKIENLPEPIEKNAVINILTEGLDIQAGEQKDLMAFWDYVDKLPKEQRKTAIQTFIQIYKTITPEEEIAAENAAIAKAGGSILPESVQQKIRDSVGKVATTAGQVEPIFGKTGILSKTGNADKTKDKKGDRDTMFDDMLKKLKLFQKASVNALGTFKELERVMNPKLKKGGAYMVFDGITNQLIDLSKSAKNYGKSISTDFIDMVEGLSPEELQNKFGKFIKIAKDGTVSITQNVQDLNRAMAAVAAGEIVAGNVKEMKKLEDRTAAVNKLRKLGVDYATAMAITESNSLAIEIKNGNLKGQALDELIQSQQKRNDLEEYYNKVVLTKQQDAIVSQQTANDQMLEFLELQNAIAENQFIIQKTEIEISAKRNGYTLELINYEEELVNKVYDKQIEALDEIVKRNEEINRLQEGRFSIAEALARGDMAAAARAIQSVRQQEIQAQLEAKRKGIEEARKKTLESITADGKTRKQIEEENAKNAAKLAEINLDTIKKQIAYAQEFTKAIGRTPEELKAYNDIAAKIQAIGGFKLDSQSLLSAIKDAVAGKPQALLTSVASVINERIKDLFGAKVAGIAMNYDENGNPIPKPSEGGIDVTPIGLNTTATSNNTAALRALTEKITVGSISAKSQQEQGPGLATGFGSGAVPDDWMFNRDLPPVPSDSKKSSKKKTSKKKKSSGSSSGSSTKTSSTKNQPSNPRQAENKNQSTTTTTDGAWRELPAPPKTFNVPKQAIDALPELTRAKTVSGGEIDITVRPNPDDVAATVARIEHEEMLAIKQKETEDEARATAATQLAAVKAFEAASVRYADAGNRQSAMQLEMAATYKQTMEQLQSNLFASNKSEKILTDLDARGAAVADILDNPKVPTQALAALANEDNGYLGVIARAQQASAAQLGQKNAIDKSSAALSAEDARAEVEAKRQAELKAKADAEAARLRALGIAGLALGNEDNLTARGEVYTNQQTAVTKAKQNAASAKSQKALDTENMLYGLGIQLGQIASNAKIVKEAAVNKSTKALESQDTRGAKIAAVTAAQVVANAQGPIVQKVSNILDRTERNFTDYNAKVTVGNTLKTAQQTAADRAREAFLRANGLNMGGLVPKYFAAGGYGRGTDIIPAMLTPGEFVVQKRAVDILGTNAMNTINNGELPGNSVYNYSLSVNVSNSNANPNDIARVVINQIKQIDSQRIRSNR